MPGSIFDFYGMIEVVLSDGGYVVGVHEVDDVAAAKELAKRLTANVKEVVQ